MSGSFRFAKEVNDYSSNQTGKRQRDGRRHRRTAAATRQPGIRTNRVSDLFYSLIPAVLLAREPLPQRSLLLGGHLAQHRFEESFLGTRAQRLDQLLLAQRLDHLLGAQRLDHRLSAQRSDHWLAAQRSDHRLATQHLDTFSAPRASIRARTSMYLAMIS